MKKILIAGIALTSISAYAEWSLKNEKGMNDLMYLPQSKSVYGTTGLFFNNYEAELGSIKLQRDETIAKQVVGYGLTDDLAISLGLNYRLTGKTKTTITTTNSVTDTKDKGLEDPNISFKYRFLKQDSSIFSADLNLMISPSLGKEKSSSVTVDGNAYRGGSLYSLSTDFGKKYTDMSWKVSVGLDMYGKQTSIDNSTPVETSTENSRTDINIGFSWQWVTSPTFIVNLNTGVGFSAESTTTNPVGDLKTTADSSNTFNLGTDLIFNVAKNMSINLGINGKSYSETNIKFTEISTGNSVTGVGKNYTEGIFSIATKYEF